MRIVQRLTTTVALLGLSATLGCAEGQLLDTKTKQGAVIGTLAGAAAGAAIGGKKHRAGGALIGAATGAIAGGLVGNYLDKQAKEIDAIPGAEVERRDDSLVVNFAGGILFDTWREAGPFVIVGLLNLGLVVACQILRPRVLGLKVS